MKKLLRQLKQWGFDQLTSNTEGRSIKKVLKPLPRSSKVLDVGCGYGDKIKQLQKLGFTDFVGVEKNPEIVKAMNDDGHKVFTLDQIEEGLEKNSFDLLVLSHIIEHFDYQGLKDFIEFYLGYLKEGGTLLIVTPTLSSTFYNDFDHVKPYNVQAINNVFQNEKMQVQFGSPHRLKILDFYFRKSPLLAFFPYRGHVLGRRNPLIDLLNLVIAFGFKLSGGTLGKVTGWVATYKYLGVSSSSQSES
ncbi:MAG: class I SAM-dependent methyltransferase [Bdellovibrionales bacterium]|nr:class I SAM-dependent methyltransferase [Bdellovibrionales bacterium]